MIMTVKVPSLKLGRKLEPKVAASARAAMASPVDPRTTLFFQRMHQARVGR